MAIQTRHDDPDQEIRDAAEKVADMFKPLAAMTGGYAGYLIARPYIVAATFSTMKAMKGFTHG